jgi:hypothetical protein
MHVCTRIHLLCCLCLCPLLCAPLCPSVCKEAWDKHGSSSGGYYVCNKYDASVKDGKLSTEEQSTINNQKLLQKYTYYYKRYKSSWDGAMLTRKLSDTLERTMRNQDLARYSFIFEALSKLVLARRVLQWSYALSYYFKAGPTKLLFEYQQELLVGGTESLQEVVDANLDVEKLIVLRNEIVNKTASIDKFRCEMVAQVERGEFEELLLSQADTIIDGKWACANCKADNAQKATVSRRDESRCTQSRCASMCMRRAESPLHGCGCHLLVPCVCSHSAPLPLFPCSPFDSALHEPRMPSVQGARRARLQGAAVQAARRSMKSRRTRRHRHSTAPSLTLFSITVRPTLSNSYSTLRYAFNAPTSLF